MAYPEHPASENYHQPGRYSSGEEAAPVMTFADWLVTLLIMSVPVVNFIMLIVWAADTNSNPNRVNWARASLIIMSITFLAGMFFMGAILGSISNLLQGFDTTGLW
jgi:hypothetical protein